MTTILGGPTTIAPPQPTPATPDERKAAENRMKAAINSPAFKDRAHSGHAALVDQWKTDLAVAVPATADEALKVRMLGVELDPMQTSDLHGHLGRASALMRSPAFLDGSDPLHAATVAEVEILFRAIHPEKAA